MSEYPLASLLTLRRYREDKALRRVAQAQATLKEAEAAAQKAAEALKNWESWAQEEKERRYAALLGHPTTIEGLETFHRGLADLAAMTLTKKEAVMSAQSRVTEAQKSLRDARQSASTARRNTAKMQAHHDRWQQVEKRASEHAEDLEFEDFQSGGPLTFRPDD